MRFRSIELLINLSSMGFLREGCRLLKNKDIEGNFEEYDAREKESSVNFKNDIPNMNRVANGEYWHGIIEGLNDKKITIYEAEEKLVFEYCNQLRKVFRYVINIPIKPKIENMPKYRMVFCTNNYHGYIEMATDMNKRWDDLQALSNSGQTTLFGYDVDYKASIHEKDVKKVVIKELDQLLPGRQYWELLCAIIDRNSILYSLKEIDQCIREMERVDEIKIERIPAFTEKTRKPTTWVNYKKNMRIYLNERG